MDGHAEDTGRTERAREMVVIHTANGEIEAQTLRSVLDAAGIPVQLRIESANKVIPVTVDGLGAVKILVPADREEEARLVLETPAESIEDDDQQ